MRLFLLLGAVWVATCHAPSIALANDPVAGGSIYQSNCAGCHGAQGVALIPGAPSFASGERLENPDMVLLNSIRNGKNLCPSWFPLFSNADLLDVLAYIRTMQ